MLGRNPGFTITGVLTLALGIGTTAAIFSVVSAVLLDPLPVEDSHRLMKIGEFDTVKRWKRRVSPALFLDLQQQEDLFEDMCAFTGTHLLVPGDEFPETVYGSQVTPNFFALLAAKPVKGRTFLPGEGQSGNDKILVVSHSFWQRYFGGDPNVVGRTISAIDGARREHLYTVIGIMPPEFQFPRRDYLCEFWRPHILSRGDSSHPFERVFRNWGVAARLHEHVSRQQSQAVADTISQRLAQEYPDHCANWRIQIQPLRNMFYGGKVRQTLLGLLGTIALILLLICANMTNLLLARSEKRQKEIAIRTALGAGRLRLVRQLGTECLLLALLGGALGLLVMHLSVDALTARIPLSIPRMREITVDEGLLGLICLISILTGAGFGLLPAWQSSKPRLNETLKETGGACHDGVRPGRIRDLLVVSEMALALVLLVGAGLMIQSVARLLRVDTGFDPHNMLSVGVSFAQRREPGHIRRFVEHFQALPGVKSVGLSEPGSSSEYVTEGGTVPISIRRTGCSTGRSDYFKVMNIPLLIGRHFSAQDTHSSRKTIIINETMAQLCWPGEDPLGKRVKSERGSWEEASTVVGVVRDVKDVRLDYEYGPRFFIPFERSRLSYAFFMVRTQDDLDPLTLTKAIRREIKMLDPTVSVPRIRSVKEELFDSTGARRTYMKFMSLFAGVGLLLAVIGVYGVMSCAAARRTHEIGIRIALGARRSDVLRLTIKKGLSLVAAGLVMGVAGAIALTRMLASLLYDITATDPMTIVAVSLLLTSVALAACYIPARRATKIDPIEALRYE